MKQNKAEKLLAGVLSISLAMGVSVMPAFAASGETYADMDSVVIKKNYELANEGTFSPAETFSFDIEADNVTDASDDITPENMPMPTIGTVSYRRGEAGSTTKTKEIKIDLPEYDSVGVYTYIIHEVAGHSAGVTYYGDAILLRVTVIEQDGKLRIAAVHTEDPESTGEGKKDDFDNLYSAGELEVHKDVEGIMGNKDKYFEFTVQLTGEEGKTYQDSYAITGGSYDANPASIKIRPGETTEATFYLKDGDTIHIENLPYGVEYKVSETPVADDVTTETGTEGEVDEAVEQANFTNTKGGTVDAGVVLDSAPYLFTLTGAAGVGLLLTLRRRHQK
jgi:pilin isopeptide linkage protein